MKFSLKVLLLLFSIFLPALIFGQSSLFAKTRTFRNPTPTPTPTPAAVNSYELFWPLVAGKVRGESYYFLKSLKESLREKLILSSFKKADYNITLTEKRTVEAEKLLVEKKDNSNAIKTLEEAQKRRETILGLLDSLSSSGEQNVFSLKTRFKDSLERQRALLNFIATKLSEDTKAIVLDNVDKLNSVLAKLQ